MPCVYFIQPAELRNTNRYKIGRSSKDDLSRVRSYKNGSRYILIIECDDDKEVEKLLIARFNKEFAKIAGNEYFQGDENEMFNIFINTVTEYKNKIIEEEPDTIKTEKLKINWMEKFKYK
jgi:hypothetical protein